MTAEVRLVDVWKRLGHNDVLKGIGATVPAGQVACVIGPSGAGKSTLLRCVNHLERPDRGLVLLDGVPIGFDYRSGALHEWPERKVCDARARIGMVFQRFNVFRHMTALQNVICGQVIVQGRSASEAATRARECLQQVGLADKGDRYPSQLSGGEQQRVAIARALAMDPAVMLFDEPTSALDAELVGEVLTVMRALADAGMTMLVATHELNFARDVAGQILFMDAGEILEAGSPEQVLGSPKHARTQTFLSRVRRSL
jgi:polar amino acid transport system ATP-binding protein